jgi:hypothetical protein
VRLSTTPQAHGFTHADLGVGIAVGVKRLLTLPLIQWHASHVGLDLLYLLRLLLYRLGCVLSWRKLDTVTRGLLSV